MRRAWRTMIMVPFGMLAFGCTPPPVVTLTPEAAVQACEGPLALELRSRDGGFQSMVLEPAATSRIERRPRQVGSQSLSMLVAGRGTARLGAGPQDVRYTCLIGPDGRALFVDVENGSGGGIGECGASASGTTCLRDVLAKAERGLAEAEARAIARAREGTAARARAEVDEPAVTSIGAWRIYRDAECARRHRMTPETVDGAVSACRIALTRERIRELGS